MDEVRVNIPNISDAQAIEDVRADDEVKAEFIALLREPEVQEGLDQWEAAVQSAGEVSHKLFQRDALVREWIRLANNRKNENRSLILAKMIAEAFGEAMGAAL